MQERDHQVLGTLARSFVNQLDTRCLTLSQRLGHVLHVEGHMMHTAATTVLLNELSDRRLGARRLQQLNFHFTNLEEGGLHFLVCYFLDAVALATGIASSNEVTAIPKCSM